MSYRDIIMIFGEELRTVNVKCLLKRQTMKSYSGAQIQYISLNYLLLLHTEMRVQVHALAAVSQVPLA